MEKNNKWITLQKSKKIISQMENNICKIILDNCQYFGFLSKIFYPKKNKFIPILITKFIYEDILNKNKQGINIIFNDTTKFIELNNKIKYTSKIFDITIIEIAEKISDKYLDLQINDNIDNIKLINNFVYMIHHPQNEDICVSFGVINQINKDEFIHSCSTSHYSSNSIILDLFTNKVIGIHKNKKNGINFGSFLNIPINEFLKQYDINNTLLDFNKKYNMNIKLNETELIINRKTKDCLDSLSSLHLQNIEKLDLSFNNLSDIKFLEKVILGKLKSLNLNNNEINNIKILEKVSFNELKELNLSSNKISDIEVFEKCKFNKLEKLNLSDNKIQDISKLEKVNFNDLKELYLSNTNISNLGILEKVKFQKLEKLYLNDNEIKNIYIFKKVNFRELIELNLSSNKISDIDVFGNAKFEKLELLDLNHNQIKNISILEKVNFKELKRINLSYNRISDIEVLGNVKFDKLEILDLKYNEIKNIKILKKIKFQNIVRL